MRTRLAMAAALALLGAGARARADAPPADPGPPGMLRATFPEAERFDSAALVAALRQHGLRAALHRDADAVVAELSGRLGTGAVVLIMSNGAFDNIHEKLLAALRARLGAGR